MCGARRFETKIGDLHELCRSDEKIFVLGGGGAVYTSSTPLPISLMDLDNVGNGGGKKRTLRGGRFH